MTAIRVIRGYRTVSYTSTTVLVATPPLELQALALKERYEGKQVLLQGGPEETLQHVNPGKVQINIWRRWRARLEVENRVRPYRAVCAVLPNWEKWRNQREAPLTYRMTLILTGHGVFGEFLLCIGKESTSICHYCRTREDSAQHTLTSCPAWEEPRRVLRMEVGEDLAPEILIKAILGGCQGRSAVRAFCEQVMLAKERAEGERVRTGHPARVDRNKRRTRRGGPQTTRSNDARGVVPLVIQYRGHLY
jgi:hypothetical protein